MAAVMEEQDPRCPCRWCHGVSARRGLPETSSLHQLLKSGQGIRPAIGRGDPDSIERNACLLKVRDRGLWTPARIQEDQGRTMTTMTAI